MASAEVTTFAPLIGEVFQVADASTGAPITRLKLVEAKSLPDGQPGHRAPFSLIFDGPAACPLEQGTYLFGHPGLEDGLPIFIVPVAQHGDVRDYQAIFA